MDAWTQKNKVGKNPTTKTPLEWGMSLQKWGPEASRIGCAVGEEIGMVGITGYAGPDPWNLGRINLFLTPLGKGPTGLTWPQFDPEGYQAFRASMIAFAKMVYTPDIRASRSIHQTDQQGPRLQVWGSADPTRTNQDDDMDSARPSQSSRVTKPGPGKNSAGIKLGKRSAAVEKSGVKKKAKKAKKSRPVVSDEDSEDDDDDDEEEEEEEEEEERAVRRSPRVRKAKSLPGPVKSAVAPKAKPKPSAKAQKSRSTVPDDEDSDSDSDSDSDDNEGERRRSGGRKAKSLPGPVKASAKSTTVAPKAKPTPPSQPSNSAPPRPRPVPKPVPNTTHQPSASTPSSDITANRRSGGVLGPREAVKAEGWIMVYMYALNPEGNMAELLDQLREILGDYFEDDNWDKIVQMATDEDGDNKAAANRISAMAPDFVTFPKQTEEIDSGSVVPETEPEEERRGEGLAEGTGRVDEGDGEGERDEQGEDGEEKGGRVIAYDPAETASVWNHPNSEWWAPWVKDTMQTWKKAFEEHEMEMDDMWSMYWQELIEVWLDQEDEFGNVEKSGNIISNLEPGWIEEWRKKEPRPAVLELGDDFDELEEELKEVEKWWKDICPEEVRKTALASQKGKEKEAILDLAPLDRTAGQEGVYMLIMALTSLVIRCHELAVNPIHVQRNWMANWLVLVGEMKEVLAKVQEHGLTIPKKTGQTKEKGKDSGKDSKGKRKRAAVEEEDEEVMPLRRVTRSHAGGENKKENVEKKDGKKPKKSRRH
ncbi:hypothetical protein VKT23_008211 [Stygiomarasmius scandens]|uniref:Uncharacterized protein n=1 Tax=Marasmiellus scandens TaxID=2682957 RepID=A0ABR1JNS0_9AGAR